VPPALGSFGAPYRASMRQKSITEIYSFDRDFGRVPDIKRLQGRSPIA
jgi:predicted nucleic acid-binding protein